MGQVTLNPAGANAANHKCTYNFWFGFKASYYLKVRDDQDSIEEAGLSRSICVKQSFITNTKNTPT